MSSSPAIDSVPPPVPSTTPSSPATRPEPQFHTSTPNYIGKRPLTASPLNAVAPTTAPGTPTLFAFPTGDPSVTPPPRSPAPVAPVAPAAPACGDSKAPLDGTSSDKSSETAVAHLSPTAAAALTRKESYKAQRQNYRREKKRAATALLHSIEDPAVVVLADWLKVRGSLKSWTKLWCVLKPGLLLLYKSPKAKSSHWVGTVLLTSCQVIERPSKKDGFCFKLYHPLEQSIWAPRGPHNEAIGAVVQPLPTAHLIFRAPSQAAGHSWLDGLELALRSSNAMLRCSRSPKERAAMEPTTDDVISHEELEKHFNEHDARKFTSPIMSVTSFTTPKAHSTSKWAQFKETIDQLARDDSTDSQTPESDKKEERGFLDFNFLKKIDVFDRNAPSTCSMRVASEARDIKPYSKSCVTSPSRGKHETIKIPYLGRFDIPKLVEKTRERSTSPSLLEENVARFLSTFPKRRGSMPHAKKRLVPKRISDLRESGAKTDSENSGAESGRHFAAPPKFGSSEVLCRTPENFVITKTSPSLDRCESTSSSSTDDVRYSPPPPLPQRATDKFSLINCRRPPSASYESLCSARLTERVTAQGVRVAGKVLRGELAGAESDSDSEAGSPAPAAADGGRAELALAALRDNYVEDTNREVGQAGELSEEVAEENKSLLWFLLKQVRPGMDLSKVVLPTFILEPRSFLDKLADYYYHSDLLAIASKTDDPYLRFLTVVRWYLSGMYRKPKGLKKPYNPVLGECFRCYWQHADDSRTYYIAEQVSHHPPVSAFYACNRRAGYAIEGSLLARSKFYGNSTSALLIGCVKIHLLDRNETYITTAPYAHCKGIVLGTLSMELAGKVQILCMESGYSSEIEFKLRAFLGGSANMVSGKIKKGKDVVSTLDGFWDSRVDLKDKKTGEESCLIDVPSLKERRLQRYIVAARAQCEHESQRLWTKVSEAIQREDQVAATEQKTIIEEAQRLRAKSQDGSWQPRHFRRAPPLALPAVEGLQDQGWEYIHKNLTPWSPNEVLEYEDNFVIQSVQASAARRAGAREPHPRTDSDSGEMVARRAGKSTQTRNLKGALNAIELTLKEQAATLQKLTRAVDSLHGRAAAAAPAVNHSWEILCGFVLAFVLQALLSWLFSERIDKGS